MDRTDGVREEMMVMVEREEREEREGSDTNMLRPSWSERDMADCLQLLVL